MGGAAHVSSIMIDMFWIILSSSVHICCHWFCGSLVLLCRMVVMFCIWVVCFSENLLQNLFIFSGGIGLRILGLMLFGVGVGSFEIMMLGGTSRHIG